MATYKEIKGITIQTLDTDPVENVGTWASGGSLNTAGDFRGTAGIQTAAITVGGQPQPCLLYTSPSPRDGLLSRMPSSA